MSQQAFKNPEVERPDIFAYRDYKLFLRDYLHYLKLVQKDFSIRKLAESCDIAQGYLSTILNSKTHLTKKALDKLMPKLNFSREESAYFKILCTIHEEADQEKRGASLLELQKFEKYSKLNPQEALVSRYFSKWYYVAIRELANLEDFRVDPEWIRERLNFSISLSEVSQALDFLLSNRLIFINANGKFCASTDRIICEGKMYRFILTNYHKEMVEHGIEAIDLTSRDHRNVKSHTTGVSKEDYKAAKEIMDKALEEIEMLSKNSEKKTEVYHFVFMGYPLTKVEDKNDEE